MKSIMIFVTLMQPFLSQIQDFTFHFLAMKVFLLAESYQLNFFQSYISKGSYVSPRQLGHNPHSPSWYVA